MIQTSPIVADADWYGSRNNAFTGQNIEVIVADADWYGSRNLKW